MGIRKPIISEIGYRTYLINEFGMANCFVLLGKERGLVIDVGCGVCDMRRYVEDLCKLPYDVVITHGHCDHIGSADLWDKVWIHPEDWPQYRDVKRGAEMAANYPDMMAPHGTYDAYDIPQTIHYPAVMPEPLPLEDGQVFDLGGRKIEVIHTPGHSLGECVFLDAGARILFSGDACNKNLGIMATSINTALKGLLKVKARQGEFDRNFCSHSGYGGNTFAASMPPSTLDDCLHIMRSLLNGTAQVQNRTSPFRPGAAPIHFVQYGEVLISFDPARLMDPGEEAAE